MKYRVLILSALLFLAGCASYKQLKPTPLLTSAEGKFIELKDKDKRFELKMGESFYLVFPAPKEDNFYIAIKAPFKDNLTASLTNSLVKESTPGEKIKDETFDPKSMYVFPVSTKDSVYYLLLENLKQDVIMNLDYRYVPQWRFKFENSYAGFLDIYKKNSAERSNYDKLGSSFHFDNFNYASEIGKLNSKTEKLTALMKELLAIESIFPKSILNSTDKAYQNYKNLKTDLQKELDFQAAYLATLTFFKNEYETRANPTELLKRVDNFVTFFKGKDKIAPNVLTEAKTIIAKRYEEILPFYDQRLKGKADYSPFDKSLYLLNEFNKVKDLYDAAGISLPQLYLALSMFLNDFDKKSLSFDDARKKLAEIAKSVSDLKTMPDNNFFTKINQDFTKLKSTLPTAVDGRYGKYLDYRTSQLFNAALDSFSIELKSVGEKYAKAASLVTQLNGMKSARDFGSMITLLTQNRDLDFLISKYSKLDTMSVDGQSASISSDMEEYKFFSAEKGLSELFRDQNFLDAGKIITYKNQRVRSLEDSLYIQIDRLTRSRVRKFLDDNIDTLENIDSLYEDSVFLPVHNVTFSTGSNATLAQKKEQLIADLAKMKVDEFPRKAVKILYTEFVKRPDELGVAMARAIVTHGKHYEGDDKKIKRMIAECNPWQSKWIVKPKQYRRVFALPLTSNEKGVNRYFLRLNIRIPTDAKFPVYDVNIKLPKSVAKNAGSSQWYEKILMNKKPLKNEGRFSISAPTAANNYECQITPVRMKATGNNYLDIYFKDKSFRVHSVSVMVQKPIIKKN